ncbi:a-factor receptor [Tilletia horrida]|uniref:A-factor receptor n=1 Tax=Tilletia horrida TaxID=155126 RepID=A0AAN6GS25_9BASI|nr:a-factor receptor [Tilletia horrida]
MASTEALITFPFNVYTFVTRFQFNHKVSPWISWADTHYDFSYIGQLEGSWFDESLDQKRLWLTLEVGRWGMVIGCWVIFLFFGTSPESRKAYGQMLEPLRKHLKTIKGSFGPAKADPPTGSVVIERTWNTDMEACKSLGQLRRQSVADSFSLEEEKV